MLVAWKKIDRMIKEGYVHNRKHFELDKVKLPFLIGQAVAELKELMDAPDDPQEMADLLGILIHYCIKQGWTREFMQKLIIEKLNLRFDKPK